MTILTEGNRKAEFLVSEANDYRARDEATVTVATGGDVAGTVLGKITATGKFVRHDAGAGDGSEVAVAVLFANHTTAGDTTATIIARDAEVNGEKLTYAVGADAAAITATNAALASVGIVVR